MYISKFIYPTKKFYLSTNYDFLKMNFNKIAFFMHGTSGFTDNSLNYLKILHKLGFFIIAPDHIASHKHFCHHNICSKHINFSTTVNFAKKNPHIYKYVSDFRTKELEQVFTHFFQIYPHNPKHLIAVGVSEGAIAVSKAKIPVHTKFIFSYSIERNYFTMKKPFVHSYPNQRIIQVIGTNDNFFGKNNSISSHFHKVKGHGFDNLKHLNNSLIFLLQNYEHSLLYKPNKHICTFIKFIFINFS